MPKNIKKTVAFADGKEMRPYLNVNSVPPTRKRDIIVEEPGPEAAEQSPVVDYPALGSEAHPGTTVPVGLPDGEGADKAAADTWTLMGLTLKKPYWVAAGVGVLLLLAVIVKLIKK